MDQKTRNDILLHLLDIHTHGMGDNEFRQMSAHDWKYLVQQAARHGVIPILHHRLKLIGAERYVPADMAQKMRKACRRNAMKNLELYHELSKVLVAIQNKAKPIIVLKGAALAALVYQSIALRPMRDVDLLVKGDDIWNVDKIILQLGYENVSHILVSKTCTPWDKHVAYWNGVIRLEVHPGIYELPNLDPWANASSAQIASVDTRVLGITDLLLHLCLHTEHHLQAAPPRLIWWCDIVEVLKRYGDELDWDYVMQMARDNQVMGSIHSILHVLNEGSPGRVPADVLSQMGGHSAAICMDDLLDWDMAQAQLPKTSGALSIVSRIPSFRGRIYYSFRKFFPRKKHVVYRYSKERPNRVYFYYIYHVGKSIVEAPYRCLVYLWNRYKNTAYQGIGKQ